MPKWTLEVFSSNVTRIGYDPNYEEMEVTWTNGKTSVYSEVPEDLAEQISKAHSVGESLHSMIKGAYPHRYR